ncbi:L,D-transpeptidase family protein [Pseudorhodoplanes sp.]|uniref:L,D-transpeptidase family protein n=1 Tax=Pseudorhodoplanes sp. TaxID=1934341 RepID=UPI003D0B26D7
MRQVVTLGVISVLSVGTAVLSPLPAHATSDTTSPASTSPASTSPAAETPAASPTVDEPIAASPTVDEPVAASPAPETPAPALDPATTTPAAQESIAASPAPTADQILAEAMRETLGGSLKGLLDQVKDVEALRAFYAARNNAPVFVRPDGATEKMQAAIARIKDADQDGLNAADYPMPAIDGNSPDKLVRAELSLMASALKYARHAQAGRIDPSRISVNIAFTPPVPDSLQVLNTISDAADVAAALDSFNPPHAGFRELRAQLRELRAKAESANLDPATPVSVKPVSAKPVGGKPHRQKHNRQKAERPKPDSAIETVIANMERWRWLPRDLGENHVIVNIPDYTLSVIRGGQRTFHTRIVVGKKDTPSPVFSDEIESVQVNPTWHVPPAILARNPGLVGRGDFVVSRRADGSIGASQRPGPQNALGQIKINFPNSFLVYLHDTPDKNLFKLDKRAYSSGCMRVENPDQFAAQVLSIGAAQGNNYTPAQLTSMYNKGERMLSLATRVPIYLVYMNAYVADGKLVVKPDLYDYDARVRSALKGRYIVVRERSQRGSTVTRAARPVSPPQHYRMGQWPGQNGQGRGFFGLF